MKPTNCAQALLIALGVERQVVPLGCHKTISGSYRKSGPGRYPLQGEGEDRRADKRGPAGETKLQRAARLGQIGVRHG